MDLLIATCIKPHLQPPYSGKFKQFFGEDEAIDRLAVSANQFWPEIIPPWCRLGPGGFGGKPLYLQHIPLRGRGCCGTEPSWLATLAHAATFQEWDEAEGFPDAAQGDVKGAEIKGGIEEAVQAVIKEGEFFHEGVLERLVLLALLEVALAGAMLGVAAEGGRAKAELPGQGTIGHPIHKAAVDLRAGGVRADGTALHHTCAPRREFPDDAGWISGYQGRRRGASTGGTVGRK
jgi:hypothetical protein